MRYAASTAFGVALVCSVACGNIVESGIQHEDDTSLDVGAADATAPLLQGIGVTQITVNSAVVAWGTDELATSHVQYGTTTSYGQTTPLYGLALTHKVTLAGLSAGTLYHYRVKSLDGAGNLATSADLTFTTTGGAADATAPTISISAPTASASVSGTVTVRATASDNVGVAGVQFLIDGAAFAAEDATAPYEIAWDTALLSNGTHTVSARARDAAGNQKTSTVITVTVSNACAVQTSVTASVSTFQDPNVAANVLDNNYATRWSGQGVGATLTLDLGATRNICSVALAWYMGNSRVASFDIALSNDGSFFSEVYSGSSSGTSTVLESYDFANADARYVRLIANGTNANDWNSVLEARVMGGAPTGSPIPGGGGNGGGDHRFPYSYADQEFFASAAPGNPTSLGCGTTVADRSITAVNNGNAVLTNNCSNGTTTVSRVRLGGDGTNGGVREGYRCAGSNATMNIVDSWLEAKGVGDDHADTIQCYNPNNSPSVMNVSNTTIRAYNGAATAGLFVADYYALELHLTNVLFWGGPYGLRFHTDGRPGSVYLKDVCFYGTGASNHSFGYNPILMSPGTPAIQQWENVNWCTIENGALVVHGAIPRP